MRRFAELLLIVGAAAGLASAGVIDSNTGGAATKTAFLGESFTTPGGGPFTNIAFNFFSDAPALTPTASGTAFLLSQAYTGTPTGLDTSTGGFIAETANISAGRYIFNPSVILQSNTKYFVYENVPILASGGNAISGGEGYFAFSLVDNFATAQTVDLNGNLQAANFAVTADAVVSSVPEPATFALSAILFGAGGIATLLRRRT